MPQDYITITSGLRGFFAVHITLDEDGCPVPWQSGIGSYATADEAIPEAQQWAEAEGIPFRR
jgi:hypothetical protein